MKNYLDRKWLIQKYLVENLGISQIAEICHVSLMCIHKYLVRFNIPRRPFHGRRKALSGKWKGGRTKTFQGYVHVICEGHPRARKRPYSPYVPEQILVVERHLGRLLTKKEFVHHINEIKHDNRLENLYLFPSNSAHMRYHQKLRKGTIEPITASNLL